MNREESNGFSTLTSMYSAWMEHQVPVTFYHYLLTVLKTKPKQDQTALMNRQITSLKAGTHLYLQIKAAIQARQSSLSIIKINLPLLKDQQVISKPLINFHEERQILGYKKLFQTRQNVQQKKQNRQLRQLANHLMIYRKITVQIVFLIHKWMAELISLGYKSLIQFIYKNQNYLEQITEKTLSTLDQYPQIFQFNPFFIIKKQLANGQYALIYNFMKINSEYSRNLYEALKLLSEHHADVLKFKMLGQHNLKSNSRKIQKSNVANIQKSNSASLIYGNLLSGRQYYSVKDKHLKSDKLLSNQSSTIQTVKMIKHSPSMNVKQLSHSPILINPQVYPRTNFIQRKYPTFFSDNTQNEVQKRRTKAQLTSYLLEKKYSTYMDKINHKHTLIVKNSNSNIQANIQTKINNGLQSQYMKKAIKQLDQQRKFIQEMTISENRAQDLKNILQNSEAFTESRPYMSDQNEGRESKISVEHQSSPKLQFSQVTNHKQVQFKVEKNVHPNNVLRYLRETFKNDMQQNDNSNKMTSLQIQTLAKMMLKQRQYISVYKIISKTNPFKLQREREKKKANENSLVWMVCKLYKDSSTLQKTVDILYMYQFQSYDNLQSSIINFFGQYGYTSLKQNGKQAYQSDSVKYASSEAQVVRCKYKVSPFASQEDIKQLIKGNPTLKMSRILKYHYYNKTSRYHKFCEHKSKQGTCSIGYNFDEISKIFINNKGHIKAKIDSISRIGECYKVYHHLNKTFLILATTIEDLNTLEKEFQREKDYGMDKDSSFDHSQNQTKAQFNYLCFQEAKFMRKYVSERDKPLINEFVWIQSNIPEVRSIAVEKKQVIGSDCMVLSQPYVLAIYSYDQSEGYKSLSVLDFSE